MIRHRGLLDCNPIRTGGPLLLAVLIAATLLLTPACRESKSGAEAASPNSSTQVPELRAEDFDPKPDTPTALKISGQAAYQNLKDFVALGPRPLGSNGHTKAEQ